MIGYTIFRRRRRASGIGGNCARISNNTNTKLRTITATFLAGIFTLSIFSQLTAYAAGNLFKIKTAEITEISASAEGNITSYDDEIIVSNIEFHQLNDEAKFKVILENTSAKDHIIEAIEDDNTNPYIIYIYDNHAGETVAAGSELVFEFVAKYETQAAMDARAIASNVKFFIKYTEVEEPDEIELLVPNTGWGTVMGTESNRTIIRISTIATIISGAALIVICVVTFIRRKQSRNRRTVRSARRVAVVALALAAITVSATVRAINIETSSFTLTTNYALKDRLQVTWTDAEGNEHEEIVNYNEQVNIPEQTKEGHTLTGWEDENGNPVDPTQPFTDDTKIHPVFRAHKYAIKFNSNGATDGAMDNLEMTFGEAKTLPANAFVWSGRTYTGWDTEANGSGAHYGDQDSVADLTTEDNVIVNLYAQWSINPFHINYDGNEATSGEMATTNCEYDQECILRENTFARTGYDFKGWTYNGTDYADKADVTNIIENGTITMVAKWELHEYTITYLGLTDEEKDTLRTQGNPDTYTILTPSFTLHNPEDRYDADGDKTQHFEGWRESTVSTTITLPQTDSLSNKIYEAIWSDVATPEYTVTYNYDGGDVATANKTKFTKFESFTLNEPVKEGYTFTGWTGTDVTTETKPYTVPAGVRHNLEFTAHYRKNTYSVAFDINTDDTNVSGSMSLVTGLEYDTNYNLTANAFARTGYTFGGWNTQADGQGNDYADQGEFNNLTAEDGGTATLYAKWNPTQYTIVFHANNENVENPDAMAAQVVTYDVETALNPIEYTWWQHKLVEWTTNANGTGTKYADKATIKNLNANGGEVHLYAKWREIDAALDGRGNLSNKNITNKLKAITIANPDAKNFLHYPNGEPSDEIKASATDLSGTIDPIYAWVDGENIYWWSEDVKPRISTNNSVEYHYYGVGKSTAEGNVNNLEYMDLTGFDTTGIVGSRSPFEYTNIKRVDISDWDLSNATDMSYFAYHSNLEDIIFPEHFDIQKVTSLNMAFSGAKLKKLDFRGWKTRDLKYLTNFIQSMPTITEVTFGGDFKTDNVTSMASMINANANLATINNINTLNTANVTSMRSMFDSDAAITSLDLSTFDTTALTDMAGMFKSMSGLTSLTLKGSFTAANVTNMEGTFYGVKNINTFDLSNLVSKPTNLKQTFAFTGGGAIETIDISNMDLSDVTTVEWTFFNANSGLKTIYTSSSVNPEVATDNTATFQYDTGLVGGANTHTYDVGGISSGAGSRIDDPDNGEPGYFTYKNARYIRYHDNDGDDTNDEANYALMPSYYITTDSNNPYALATSLSENKFERPGYRFLGWATSADGEKLYDDKAAISTSASKVPLELYAVWYKLEATLDTGANVNTILKNLATEPTAFEHYAGTPNFEQIQNEQDIALPSSDVPVYAWYDTDSTKIYWWSEAEKPKMNTDSSSFFAGMSSVTSIDVEGLDASNATNMSHMFRGTGLTDIDFSKLESQNVTDMSYMFHGIKTTNTLDVSKLDTSSVRNMASMFEGANFTSISFFDTLSPSASKFKTNEVTSMHYMFKDSTRLTSLDLSSFNTSNVKDFAGTFYGATGLKTLNLDGWDTGNATTMYIMFNSASSLTRLDLSHFDTKNVTTMQQMFEGCFDLEYLNVSGWSNEKVGNMSYMFHKVGNYKNGVEIILTGFKTPAVTTMSYMFTRDVTELETLDLSSFDTSNVTSMSSMFGGGSQGNGTFYNAKIKTVYASDKFVTTKVDPESNVFNNTSVIVGGAGTTWSQKTAVFARIDDPDNGNPGYFTMKGARYIRYHDNDGDDTNNEANSALMTSHYLTNTGSLKTNAFTYSGKTFTGWNTAADGSGDSYTDGQAMTGLVESKTPLELYAQWSGTVGDSHTITYYSNNDSATGSVDPQTVNAGEDATVAANGFTLTHNHFRGWNTQADGEGTHYNPEDVITNPSDDIDLYAEWKTGCQSFATDPWSVVAADFNSDPDFFDPTETCEREIEMDVDGDNEDETYRLRLINTSTPDECLAAGFSQTACGVVVEFVNTIGKSKWKASGEPRTGWYGSDLITYLNDTVYDKMPADLQNVIIPTYIVSGYSVRNSSGVITPNTSPDITLEDTDKNKIYLHSPKEIGVDFVLDNKREYTRINDFYQIEDNLTAERVLTGNTSTTRRFWSRSMADLSLVNNPPFNPDVWGWKAIYLLKNGSGVNEASYSVDTDSGSYDIIPVFRIGVNN